MAAVPAYAFVLLVLASVVLAEQAFGHAGEKHSEADPIVLAPGYEALSFEAPVPGTYALPVLQQAADGPVLRSNGEESSLYELFGDDVVVLSFIYRACDDVNGCPLATFVMQQLKGYLEEDEQLARQVKLISMSFDPANDTPEEMKKYRESFGSGLVDWEFVTAKSDEQLFPILDAYKQPISRVSREDGTSTINHMLRVFLIDRSNAIRNIYSVSLLHTDTLVSDLKTVIEAYETSAEFKFTKNITAINYAETREGYASGEYQSQSTSLLTNGTEMDLLGTAKTGALGLPPLPSLNKYTDAQVKLGRELFFDRRLSHNDTISCAMCHIPQQGFTSNEMATSVGMEGRSVRRNSPTLLNVAYNKLLFHDGREHSLEQQVWSPLLAHNEMANPSIGLLLNKVGAIDKYQDQLLTIYGNKTPSIQQIGELFSAYQSTLIAANSKFDRWKYGGQTSAFSNLEETGFELFVGKAGCSACHTIEESHALFTDHQLHNTGIGYRVPGLIKKPHPVTLAPGVVLNVDPAVYAAAAEEPIPDTGYYEISLNPDDRWKYRTPSLRNVGITAPYMHDGSLSTLTDVVNFYNHGGNDNPTLSPLMTPLGLSNDEVNALVQFLKALTGNEVQNLIADAIAAPIGDAH